MGSTGSRPKKHHYVPRAYLARFADQSGVLYIHDKAREQIRRQNPRSLMKVDSYYLQHWVPTGINPNVFESYLGAELEARAPAIFDKLEATDDAPTEDEASDLLTYLEIQRIRVPRQAAAGLELLRGEVLRSLPEDLASEVQAGRMQLTMKDHARFDFMREALGTIHPWLSQMEWEVVAAAPGSQFVTSDSPVSYFNPEIAAPVEAELNLAGTQVLFPLSSGYLLLMTHPANDVVGPLDVLADRGDAGGFFLNRGAVWSAAEVAEVNSRISTLSGGLVVASSIGALATTGLELPSHATNTIAQI